LNNPFKKLTTPEYSEFIYKSKYARWRDDLGRRENWDETVTRYVTFFMDKYPNIDESVWGDLYQGIYNFDVMPSMRALMCAGPALERDNVSGYNCSFIAIDDQLAFDEILYILCCGTGVGFSVERQYINKLPTIAENFYKTQTIIVPHDSKIGWASAYRELISLLYSGKIPKWDFSGIRPEGSRLKVFGGRASGPGPLEELFEFTINVFKGAAGRKLTSIEVHDIVCKIAAIVVVGSVRRSALISLSNLSDLRMSVAKSGQWWVENPQRALANNSVCYTEKPSIDVFLKEWLNLYESKSGERGIFSNEAANNLLPKRRKSLGHSKWGANPCVEIVLRDTGQMCNLTEVIVRPNDTLDTLKEKVRLATILGTFQATLTDFRYLRNVWKQNCEEERLLGVSLTGIMDHPVLNGENYINYSDKEVITWLEEMKQVSLDINAEWSEKLGIKPATAITAVKPSGTVSQLTDTASGIHPRYSKYYTRTVRGDNKDPLTKLMKDNGVPNEPDLVNPEKTTIFSFPIKAPESSVFRDDRTAIEQLELWKIYQLHWCEHKPSITVYVKENEWVSVAAWIYENFDIVSGVSFLPHSNHSYKQAPYQEIDEEQYLLDLQKVVHPNWDDLSKYELEDQTTAMHEYACTGNSCEIV